MSTIYIPYITEEPRDTFRSIVGVYRSLDVAIEQTIKWVNGWIDADLKSILDDGEDYIRPIIDEQLIREKLKTDGFAQFPAIGADYSIRIQKTEINQPTPY
jgi:hypothetical protein